MICLVECSGYLCTGEFYLGKEVLYGLEEGQAAGHGVQVYCTSVNYETKMEQFNMIRLLSSFLVTMLCVYAV